MPPAPVSDIAFLAPGLVHLFGNLLLTIQGHSLHLEPDSAARAKPVFLTACDRGGGALRIFRHLLGESLAELAPVGPTVLHLAELLRIPVREVGHTLECSGDAALVTTTVDLGAFVPVAVAMVRALLHAVPDGVRGQLSLGLSGGKATTLRVAFGPGAGGLPFPLATAEPLRQLRVHALRRGLAARLEGSRDGFSLLLEAAAGTQQA